MARTIMEMTEDELLEKYGITYTEEWQQLNENFDKNDHTIFYSSGCIEDIERAIADEQEVVDRLPPLIFIRVHDWIIAFY